MADKGLAREHTMLATIFRLVCHRHVTVPMVAVGCVALCGCSQTSQSDLKVQVQVSQLAPYPNAAKGPDCDMPVLRQRPLERYSEVAIVEGWAERGKADELLKELRRKACQTGADALLIVESREQVTKQHLYKATPNEESEETTGMGGMQQPGEYIQKEEHVPKVGEPGHSGYYTDSVAIVYERKPRSR
jgi:hypothetical protein